MSEISLFTFNLDIVPNGILSALIKATFFTSGVIKIEFFIVFASFVQPFIELHKQIYYLFSHKKIISIFFFTFFNLNKIYIFVEIKTKKIMTEKMKSTPVYLPDEKRIALKEISKSKRLAQTRLIEQELDKLFKREGYSFQK